MDLYVDCHCYFVESKLLIDTHRIVIPCCLMVVILISVMLLFVCVQIGTIGQKLHALFSHPIFIPISTLSFLAYLLHPTIMTYVYAHMATVTEPLWHTIVSIWCYAFFHLFATFLGALLLYVLFERPVERWLRAKESSDSYKKGTDENVYRGWFAKAVYLFARYVIFVYFELLLHTVVTQLFSFAMSCLRLFSLIQAVYRRLDPSSSRDANRCIVLSSIG